MAKSNIIIGGLVPFTTIDYPTKISAVLFLQGCPWRCIYCSNQQLLCYRKPTQQDKENYEYVLELLKKRTKILDAVVFSGGEATSQTDEIITAIEEIKEFAPHFKFGLHTNGCFPEKLSKLLPYIDWVGLDIKAPCKKYEQITKVKGSGEFAFESLEILLKSGKDFEVRTTADPTVLTKDDILEIAELLSKAGVKHYAVQRCRPATKDQPNNPLAMQFFMDKEFEEKLRSLIPNLEMRV
ncbi:MAG: anaerobic ribonucleoside-triphosphate reductase activating protein [Alphaproteobacteria bacterium]|nr:anaerobic ribonucleoside-triphosphate reductase activating protein [Alphaproteobacteria bacterium]MBQ8660416.1 anaerobic ribonucleoside-triphosphate reductase activating protein [Alphaproteobacteria bacterium]MBR4315456.1 anaerobic ribonucleoside-triphosphate reductase activating protein [Alphaproteobacteria bacterium]